MPLLRQKCNETDHHHHHHHHHQQQQQQQQHQLSELSSIAVILPCDFLTPYDFYVAGL